jgi:hypothetical protein
MPAALLSYTEPGGNVDINKLIARVKAILLTPKTEWPVIAGEQATVADLYKNYIVILAALPAIAYFIKFSILGVGGFGFGFREGMGAGIMHMVVSYLISLGVVYVAALIADALAPTFGAQKNQVQALKAISYSWTASWVAGIGILLGVWIGGLIGLAGLIYAIYLLNMGLQQTMKCPPEKAAGYTAVTAILSVLAVLIVGAVILRPLGFGGASSFDSAHFGSADSGITIDKDSSLGKLDAWSKKMEAAGKQMESAQKSGDAEATGKALGAVMGAAMGGGDQVEALAPDMLKPFVPETLAGLKRTDFSAERNGAMGMQISEAHASYSDGANRSLRLEVTDMGTAKGLMAMAGWAAIDSDKETEHGYDKTYKQDGRLVHEEWNSEDKHGEYGIVLGDRFSVKVSGNADSINDIKAAVASINLAGLEALKTQGVKKG